MKSAMILAALLAAALAGGCAEPPDRNQGASTALPAPAPRKAPLAGYPRTVRQVPPAFHGGWDELDNCAGREPRFSIAADSVYDFEVSWQVREVRLLSPTEIDIVAVYHDPERGPTNEEAVWTFRLLDNGRAIADRNDGTMEFLRCRDSLERQ